MDPRGQIALVTGAASGLGAATSARLAAEGALVLALDRSWSNGDVSPSPHVIRIEADVTQDEAFAAQFDALVREHGPPRIVVTCAGIDASAMVVRRDGPQSLETFRRPIEVNLIGTFNVLRLAAAAISGHSAAQPRTEAGVFVTCSSIAGLDGPIGASGYVASKAAVAALTRPLARELGRYGIRVNSIAPGLFDTPMLRRMPTRYTEAALGMMAFPLRTGEPAEFADLVVTICRTEYLNSETLRLDAGIRIGPE